MIDALYISASGLRSQQEQIDVISNNVANMQTPGFKKGRVSFAEVSGIAGGLETARPQFQGGGSEVLSTMPVFSEGEIRPTQNPTDFAIEGQGFFELENAAGDKIYTRSGQFRVDNEGYLVSVGGLRLAQGIQIPPDAQDVRVSQAGVLSARIGTDVDRTELATLELASFPAADAMTAIGQNNFAATEASGEASGFYPVSTDGLIKA